MTASLSIPAPKAPTSSARAAVEYDTFCQADLRIGKVHYVAPVAGSRQNLCQITVEIDGWGIGVAMSKIPGLAPKTLIGKHVVVACNIEPKDIAGIHATVLLVTVRTPDQRQASVVVPENPVISSGCLVR